MATVLKKFKIVNPGRRKAASPAQLAARAKFTAMVRARRQNGLNPGKAKRSYRKFAQQARVTAGVKRVKSSSLDKINHYLASTIKRRKARKNPSEIITIGLNPGVKKSVKRRIVKSMAKTKRRRKNPVRRAVSRRRVTRRKVSAHRRRNPGIMRAVRRRVRRYGRRSNPGVMRRRRHYSRRHNPSFGGLKTTGMTVLGLIGGAIVTKKVVDLVAGMIPSVGTGFMKYITTAVVSSVIGYGVGKFAKNPGLGSAMALGGYTLVGLQVAQDFFPGFASLSPFGLRGMGLIGPSSFYTPQVPMGGAFTNAFGNFVTPNSVMSAMPVAKGMKGLGATVLQPGRTRLTRVA